MFSNKKYSKYIYLFLAVLFVYNSFGYLFLYFPVKTIIKQVVQKTLNEKNNDNDDLSVMVFNADGLKSNKYLNCINILVSLCVYIDFVRNT